MSGATQSGGCFYLDLFRTLLGSRRHRHRNDQRAVGERRANLLAVHGVWQPKRTLEGAMGPLGEV